MPLSFHVAMMQNTIALPLHSLHTFTAIAAQL
jgi:hypothetical protein